MWFRSQKANRRFERDHVLEVKMRARQIRTARIRMIAKVVSVVGGTALTLYLLWYGSGWALNEWLYKNPAFSIKHLEVQTDGVLPIEQILAWAQVKPDDSLLAVDLLRIEREVAVAFHRLIAPALKEAAFHQQLLLIHLKQVHRARGGTGRAEEMNSHGARMRGER